MPVSQWFIKVKNRISQHTRLLVATLFVAFLLSPASWSAGPAQSITTIINLILGDTPLDVPFKINDRLMYEGDIAQAQRSSSNLLSVDLNFIPLEFRVELEDVILDVIGDCYTVGGATLDPLIYEWDVIVGDTGECGVRVTVTSVIEGQSTSLVGISNIAVSGGMPSEYDELIAMANNGEVNGAFQFTNIVKQSTAPGASDDPNRPTMYGFLANKDGVALKGVMMSSRRKFDTRNFSNLNVNAKSFVRSVQGTSVLMGSAVVATANQNSPADDEVFSFLAVAESATLPGPAGNPEFSINGKNTLQVICSQNKIAGFGRFEVARTGTRLASSLIGFTRPTGCSSNGFSGKTAIYSEFKYIDTPIGKVLRGRGTAHPLNGTRITTVDDQNNNNPDYALYFLAIPEQLSDLHKINQLDPDTTLANNVKILDPFALAKLAKVRRTNGRMFFSEQPEALLNVAIGDILIGKATARLSDGFIRRVTGFGASDPNFGLFYLETEPAGLNEVFDSGGFTLNRGLVLGDIEEVITPQYAFGASGQLAIQRPSFIYQQDMPVVAALFVSAANALNFDVLPFPARDLGVIFSDADLNYNTKNDQLRTEGYFDLDAAIDLQFRCRATLCGNPYFKVAFQFTEDFELKGIAKMPQDRINREYTIFTKRFAVIWLGPVPIRPSVNLNVSMDGFTEVPITFGIDQNFTSEVGLELDGSWDTIKSRSSSLDPAPEPNYVPGSGTANLTARAAVEGQLKIAGLAGASVDVGIYTEVTADTPRDPAWSLEAGLNSNAYVELDLILTSIRSGPFELFDNPFPVVAEAPPTPPSIEKITVDGRLVENGVLTTNSPLGGFAASPSNPLVFKITPFDAEDGLGCCVVTLRSNIDGVLGQKQGEADLTARNVYRFPVESFSSGEHTISVSIYEIGEHPSTAVVETFTIPAVATISTACQDLELDAFDHPTLLVAIEEGETVSYEATVSGGSNCFPQGNTVVFTFCSIGGNACVSTSDQVEFPTDHVREQHNYPSQGAFTAQAHFENTEGDLIYSSTAIIAVAEASPPQYSNALTNATISNFDYTLLSNTNGVLPRLFGSTVETAFAASDDTEYVLNLYNWTTRTAARFRLPFERRAGYSYSWESTDTLATILVSSGMERGNAEIRPSASGWGWQQITAIETNDSTGKSNSISKVFYVNNANSLDFGYAQEAFDENAAHIEAAQ